LYFLKPWQNGVISPPNDSYLFPSNPPVPTLFLHSDAYDVLLPPDSGASVLP